MTKVDTPDHLARIRSEDVRFLSNEAGWASGQCCLKSYEVDSSTSFPAHYGIVLPRVTGEPITVHLYDFRTFVVIAQKEYASYEDLVQDWMVD